ncbi:hypothetical protein FACS189437_08570 [Bacteroidia bacterium]|nr:hypothetical protein FACS189437_08570 [Bacteroidia bacterium]
MKKMMFLMLTLMVLGVASVNAQVRIGGTTDPDKSAVLDLNDDGGAATGGLALPRVALNAGDSKLNGETPQPGTVVYNTNAAALEGEGTYVWTKLESTETSSGISTSNDGNNIKLEGDGTTGTPLKANVIDGGINTSQLANGAVTGGKIAGSTITSGNIYTEQADSGKVLMSNGQAVQWMHAGATRESESRGTLVNSVASPTEKKTYLLASVTIEAVQANHGQFYDVVGITSGDFCVGSNNRTLFAVIPGNLFVFNVTGYWVGPQEVNCYRIQ